MTRSPNPRKRCLEQLQTPHFKIRRHTQQQLSTTNAVDPISTPLLTPGDRPHPFRASQTSHFTPLAQTPPPITPLRRHTPPKTPNPLPVSVDDADHLDAESLLLSQHSLPVSQWSGGLFSGHKPLTIESLHPTPPSATTDVCPLPRAHERLSDIRVRRLSFGPEQTPVSAVHLPSREPQSRQDRHIQRDQSCVQGTSQSAPRKRLRIRPRKLHVVDDNDIAKNSTSVCEQPLRYECSQQKDDRNHGNDHIPESVSPFPDSPLHAPPANGNTGIHTPPSKSGVLQMRTPDDTVVRRCRAPRWDGPITQIPETPTEQLPQREAPIYVVKTAVTAPEEVQSLPESHPSSPLLGSPREARGMGLMWMDIGAIDSRDQERTRTIDEDSDSASTEPPSPVRKRNNEHVEAEQYRAQVFCRPIRVSIPAGGFLSPSPEPTPPHT